MIVVEYSLWWLLQHFSEIVFHPRECSDFGWGYIFGIFLDSSFGLFNYSMLFRINIGYFHCNKYAGNIGLLI